MTQRQHIQQLLEVLRISKSGSCGGYGINRNNCDICPCATRPGGPCRTARLGRYRERKLDYLVGFMRSHDMQDLLDANPWVLTLAADEDAYYASLPI